MKIPIEFIALFAGAIVSLQGWMLIRIVGLEKKVTALRVRLDEHLGRRSPDTDRLTKL